MECSAFFPDTVQLVVDEALNAANTYYGPCSEIVSCETFGAARSENLRLQWQLLAPAVPEPSHG